jgi:hypothetical protein
MNASFAPLNDTMRSIVLINTITGKDGVAGLMCSINLTLNAIQLEIAVKSTMLIQFLDI